MTGTSKPNGDVEVTIGSCGYLESCRACWTGNSALALSIEIHQLLSNSRTHKIPFLILGNSFRVVNSSHYIDRLHHHIS